MDMRKVEVRRTKQLVKKMTKLNLKYLVPGRTVGRMIKLGQLST